MSQQLYSGRQSRAIVPTVTTASFKPLSLDEIMMVPLAKQKAEDQMIMDMDELNLMATNALEADQAYVNAQKDAYTNEVGSIRDRLIAEGVDRSLINKFKGLRSRKNLEFSVNGKTGKANAAYNAMQLNKKNIMNNNRLSAEQKRLGLLEAEAAYNRAGGVGAGAEYIDYVGSDEVDIQGEAQKIAAQMTPQTIAESKGYTFDGKSYKDSSGKDVILTPEHIQNIAYQTMLGNNKTMAYLEEAERLGIITSADDELRKAATNAANIYQRKDYTGLTNTQIGNIGKNTTTTGNGQNWTGVDLTNAMEGLYDRKTDFDEERIPNFFDANGNIIEATVGYDPVEEKRRRNVYENMKSINGVKPKLDFTDPDTKEEYEAWQNQNFGAVYDSLNQYRLDTKKKIEDLRSTYPNLTTQLKPAVMSEDGLTELEPARQYNDQEIYSAFIKGRQKASVQFSQAIKPLNVDNTFNNYTESLIGTKEKPGSFASMTMSVGGSDPAGLDATAKSLGMDPEELRQAVATSGTVIGFLPGHTSMPGAFAIQFVDPNDPNKTRILSVKGNKKSQDIFRTVSKMNDQVIKGIPHSKQVVISEGTGKRLNQHITTSMNPATGAIESYTVNTEGDYTKEQVLSFDYVLQETKRGLVEVAFKNGVKVVPPLVRYGYDHQVNLAQRGVSTMYDSTMTNKTTKPPKQ